MNEISIIYNILRPVSNDFTMLDVGAHIGGALYPFARDGAIVHAFEPDTNNRKKLTELLNKNGLIRNVFVNDKAVTDNDSDVVPFHTSNVSTGISSLSAFHPSHKQTDRVETITLKTYCKNNNIKSVDFLKVDAEGHDFFVLNGFEWENIHPEIVICEFEDFKTNPLGYNYKTMAEFLQKEGYTVLISEWHPIVEYGKKHNWNCFKSYPAKLDHPNSWGNIIAFSNRKHSSSFMEIHGQSI